MRYQLLPPLSQAEYEALRDDICAVGVRQPIDVDENGDILDGHHRKRIADEFGLECPERVVRGLADFEKADYALTVNLARRHLDRDGKRELVMNSLKLHPRLSDREHARRCGVSHPTVAGIRDAMILAGRLESFTSRTGGDGKTYPSQVESFTTSTTGHPSASTGEAPTGLDAEVSGFTSAEADAAATATAGDGEIGRPDTSPVSPQSAAVAPRPTADGSTASSEPAPTPADQSPVGVGVTPDQEFMSRFIASLAKSGGWMQFDADRVAELASDSTWDAIEAHACVVAHTYERMRKARFGLRVIKGGVA